MVLIILFLRRKSYLKVTLKVTLKVVFNNLEYFWFTIRILLPWNQQLSTLKRISEEFLLIRRLKHWMQFISLVVTIQNILLPNSRTISGADWLIWTKDDMDMGRSALEVKQWSSADISIGKRKLNHFQRINDQNLLTDSFRPLVTEVWELENGNNKTIEPTLPDSAYAYGIALYVVEKDFCKK